MTAQQKKLIKEYNEMDSFDRKDILDLRNTKRIKPVCYDHIVNAMMKSGEKNMQIMTSWVAVIDALEAEERAKAKAAAKAAKNSPAAAGKAPAKPAAAKNKSIRTL